MAYSFRSCAKINLGLRVVGKRPDGYHNLESVFQEISLCDEIECKRTSGEIKIQCDHPAVPLDEKNLCHKAFRIARDIGGLKEGIRIQIKKNIPVGAGLGGGSSNAAACLKAFNRMFDLGLSKGRLIRLAAQIGSDVPFFILGKTALIKGRGEVVLPIHFLTNYQVILVYPNFSISTASVFEKFEMNLTEYNSDDKFEAGISEIQNLDDLSDSIFNDLEKIVMDCHPVLKEIKQHLKRKGAQFVSLSGSGSVVFGLFNSSKKLEKIGQEFAKYGQVFFARPVF